MSEHTGAAVLLMLSAADGERLAVDGGEPAATLHTTVGYLARPVTDYSDTEQVEIVRALREVVADTAWPVTADAFGTAHLNPDDDERDPCAVLLVQSTELASVHDAVTAALGEESSTVFPVWVPHIALAYNTDPSALPDGITADPLTFDRLVLSWAGEQIDITPPDATETTVRQFAAGWARATAKQPLPLTERARRACHAAIRVAEASPQLAGSNATLQLGQLEGVWAVIYARRAAVEKLHGAALGDVLTAIADLDWSHILNRARGYLLADSQLTGKELARLLGRDVENLISSELPRDVNQAWRLAMTNALTAATAEGQTAALALVGQAAGVTIDWNLAATSAIDALQGSQVAWDMSSTWIEQQVHGIGYQASQLITSMWADGADPADIETALADLLTVNTSIASVLLDSAIGQALSAGALSTYITAGVQYADFITAGDGRVCATCGQAEDDSPYLLEECPQPGLHGRCRCAVAPSDYQPTAAALVLLDTYRDTEVEDLAA